MASKLNETHRFGCACGQVEFAAQGAPMARLVCYCDDCRAATAKVAALPDGKTNIGADGGTFSTVFRKDRIVCVKGEHLLTEVNLRDSSPAHRMVASCCNSAMVIDYSNWFPMVPVRDYSAKYGDAKPDFRSFTRFAPDPKTIPNDVKHYAKIPPSFGFKILGAALRRPKSQKARISA